MKFNVLAWVMMIVAIAIGKMVGDFIVQAIGGSIGGSIIGTLVIGFVCYVVYMLATGAKFNLTLGILFSIMVFFSDFITMKIADTFALGSSDLVIFVVTGSVMALLWSWVGGKKGAAFTGLPMQAKKR